MAYSHVLGTCYPVWYLHIFLWFFPVFLSFIFNVIFYIIIALTYVPSVLEFAWKYDVAVYLCSI